MFTLECLSLNTKISSGDTSTILAYDAFANVTRFFKINLHVVLNFNFYEITITSLVIPRSIIAKKTKSNSFDEWCLTKYCNKC